MSKKLTLFHINTEKSFRGGEIQTLHLMRELRKRGHQNFLIARPGSTILKKAQAEAFLVLPLNMRGEWDWMSAKQLRSWLKKHPPHILHAHTAHACSIALLARRNSKAPPIVYSRRVSFVSRLIHRKLKNVEAIIAVSSSIRQLLIDAGVDGEKIFVAESGTDFSIFENVPDRVKMRQEIGIPEEAFVIGNVSYFKPEKGQEELIRVFSELGDENAYLVLLGDGPNLDHCKKIANESKAPNRILFTGYREDVYRFYGAMDLFFLSSFAGEGWSGAVREAMGAGIPVIAVRQPSIEEQAQSGVLVSADPAEWKEAILKLRENPSLRKELAEKAILEARKYTVETMVDKIENCYYKLAR